jgi:uncharacterized repeat protein (TIGR03803 family)
MRSTRLCTAASVAAAFVTMIAAQSAQSQTYNVLYSFTDGTDGAFPYAGVIQDAAGNIYGTASTGGAFGHGTVFKLSKTGKETVLHSFEGGADGVNPQAGLVQDAKGNLYGTTYGGGDNHRDGCCGTVFKLSKTGKETVLYSFKGGADGAFPQGGVIQNATGDLYGTTTSGGVSGVGTVFKLSKTGKETVLHTFKGGADGDGPFAGLIQDAKGNLYGTTSYGGDSACTFGCGTVFKLSKTGKETVLYSFKGGADGATPAAAGVMQDAKGNLYGTTYSGGTSNMGTVFKLDTAGKETVLYSFSGGTDGRHPYAGVIQDSKGNLYGTTNTGGVSGVGTVFKLSKTGKETVLYSFTGMVDGALPYAVVVQDAKGKLYGTALVGGNVSCDNGTGCGVVFKLTP